MIRRALGFGNGFGCLVSSLKVRSENMLDWSDGLATLRNMST